MSEAYLYKQIEDEIKEQICSGALKDGDKVPSVKDIRDKHGVSHITALRVLKELAEENYIQFLKGKGYFVNSSAEYENGHELNHVIACITRPSRKSTLHDNYYNDINQAIQRTCMAKGFDTIYPKCNLPLADITVPDSSQQEVKRTILDLAEKVDGFFIDERINDSVLTKLAEKIKKTIIVVGRKTEARLDSVSPDNCAGAEKAAELCLKMKYQDFIVCENLFNKLTLQDRTDSFTDSLQANGVKSDNITTIGFNIQPYEDTLSEIHSAISKTRKTLIFSPTDSFARFLVDSFTEQGVNLGQRIGILGFSGMGYSTLRKPYISTVDIQPELIGEKAADILISRINNEFFETQQNFIVPSTFQIGETI